ncbi:D-alanyl-D-alanine endopeptidase [Ideonella sp. DXS22W]|uniref:D-alanyl-D-alanine endopeptidase n=1 Tax=Pseudaquabacterium inlustre TaxID=2984192 RepID=A0ABU9CIK4_9BURK
MKPSLSSLLLGVVLSVSLAAPASARVQTRKPNAKAPAAAAAAPAKRAGKVVGGKGLRRAALVGAAGVAAAAPLRASFGQMQGLHANNDPLDLKSSVALVVDQDTNEVLFSKNPSAVLPIASITKLMTALVVVEARQSLDEVLTVTQDDIDTEKGSRSRLAVGTQLTRREMLHLALMSSENRAANALGRHYPGGLAAAVAAMNKRADSLGMRDTRYVEPTGLSSQNQSSAQDLAKLVKEAHHVPLLREFSTSQEAQVAVGKRMMQFHTTNGLVRSPNWDIGLQKTGYISEAGRCLVMQAQLAGRKLIMVLLDSTGKYSRIGDAERIRRWLDHATAEAGAARRPAS